MKILHISIFTSGLAVGIMVGIYLSYYHIPMCGEYMYCKDKADGKFYPNQTTESVSPVSAEKVDNK